MATQEKQLAEVLQDIRDGKKNGALYISIVEMSEDLFRIYFKNGDIYHIRYGSALGGDCLELIEFYTIKSGTWFEGIESPGNAVSKDLPPMDQIIVSMKKIDKKLKVR